MELMERRRILLNTPHIDTVTGSQFVTDMVAPIESLVISFSPIQDLHGYNNPYPAGGGKNKLPYPYYGTSGTISGVEFTDLGDGRLKINGTATARTVFLLENHTSVIQSGEYIVSRGTDVSGLRITVDAYNGNKWVKALATITGDEQTITIDYDGYDRIDVFASVAANTTVSNVIVAPMFRLSSVTDATFAPYSNICPISGRESVEVKRTGKNLYNADALNALSSNGITVTVSNGTITMNGTATAKAFFSVINTGCAQGNYAFSFNNPVANADVHCSFRTTGGTYFSDTPINAINKTLTLTGEPNSIILYVTRGTTLTNFVVKPQLELGSTATAYEPYQGNTYTIQLGDTVYGGTLDVTSGVLTVDKAMVDLGTLNWDYNAGQLSMVSGDLASVVGNGANVVCSNYKTETNLRGGYWANTDKAVGINKANSTTTGSFAPGALVVKDTYYSDAATFKTAMSGVQLVYELATPQTIQLTPQQVLAFKGINNLSMSGRVKFWTHRDIQ